ncbi:MAG TPA: lysophospholipid acyltransferase family protein [Spongiibacteraceae bacterium]|jgi:KDO2-lipid IV(A) lauroyltransferase|nr:lysophospholipid acyltransferase family protein [Spongiibacteraceae bacterium]HUH36800.1 lysophospholipid acyltransferase family protein [Spongiibacteraceae bacterium]
MNVLYSLLARLPFPVLYALSDVLAWVLRRVVRYRLGLVRSNLRHAFPELTAEQRKHIERGFYRNFTDVALETIKASRMSPEAIAARASFDNIEVLEPYLERQQSMLFLACHQANWEWMLQAMVPHLPCPMAVVYKPLHNAHTDSFMLKTRARFGVQPVAFKDAGRDILRARRQFRSFVLAADQAPGRRDTRYWHDFFGRPAPFYQGPQKLAQAAGLPVLFFAIQRRRRGHYSCRIEVLADPPHAKSGFAILDAFIAAAERSIREQPEGWLWSHDKWKVPTDEEARQLEAERGDS